MEYKVQSLTVNGKGNRIFRHGDVITQNNVEASVDDLVNNGYIVPMFDEEEDEVLDDLVDSFEIPSIDELTKKDIIEMLEEKGVDFKVTDKKAVLYDLL
jgi:polyhydroxyalkanoate synthesis regulator phasin